MIISDVNLTTHQSIFSLILPKLIDQLVEHTASAKTSRYCRYELGRLTTTAPIEVLRDRMHRILAACAMFIDEADPTLVDFSYRISHLQGSSPKPINEFFNKWDLASIVRNSTIKIKESPNSFSFRDSNQLITAFFADLVEHSASFPHSVEIEYPKDDELQIRLVRSPDDYLDFLAVSFLKLNGVNVTATRRDKDTWVLTRNEKEKVSIEPIELREISKLTTPIKTTYTLETKEGKIVIAEVIGKIEGAKFILINHDDETHLIFSGGQTHTRIWELSKFAHLPCNFEKGIVEDQILLGYMKERNYLVSEAFFRYLGIDKKVVRSVNF